MSLYQKGYLSISLSNDLPFDGLDSKFPPCIPDPPPLGRFQMSTEEGGGIGIGRAPGKLAAKHNDLHRIR